MPKANKGITAAAPPDGIERRAISQLKAYPKNAKQHPPEQIDQLVESIDQFGFTIPLLIDEKGLILAGHGRLLAAEKRGMTHVPCLVARGWSAEKKRAYVIADNRLSENGIWDRQILGAELGNLQLQGFNLDVLGFAPGEVAALIAMATKVEGDPDDAPAPPESPVTREGDLWLLGAHRVLCGDSTSPVAVARLLAGAKPHLMVTDPPYGVEYDPNWRNEAVRSNGVAVGGRATGKVQNDERADWREVWALFPGAIAYVWHGGLHAGAVQMSLKAAKFNIRAQIVWVKNYMIIGRGNYHWQHEPLYYAQREGAKDDHWRFEPDHEIATYAVKLGETADWRGGRKQTTVWTIDVVKNDTGHGTQKPVECMKRPIENNSKGGDLVFDPFLGSGTTLIAAHGIGRVCLGLELDPSYCDVIVQRWQTYTGGLAVHEATGKTFEQLKEARNVKEKKTADRRGSGGGPAKRTTEGAGAA